MPKGVPFAPSARTLAQRKRLSDAVLGPKLERAQAIPVNKRKAKLKAKHRPHRGRGRLHTPKPPYFTAMAGQIVGTPHALDVERRLPRPGS
jgi:hypothetical protein